MYTYMYYDDFDIPEHGIFDPFGTWICNVESKYQAEDLLTHLNRVEDSLMRHLMEG